jgi:ankyrin repeat protein
MIATPRISARRVLPAELLLILLFGTYAAGIARAAVPPGRSPWQGMLPSVEASARKEVEAMLGRGIHAAAADGDLEGVSVLLGRRPSLNDSVDFRGFTPLHVAVLAGRVEVVRLLVEKGARVNARSEDPKGIGVTPLHLATMRGLEEVVGYLLDRGADASASDRNGVTPLHMTAFLGNAGIAARLVERCADVNAREMEGLTPLHVASDMGARDVVRLLLRGGADVFARDARGMTPRSLAERRRYREIEELIGSLPPSAGVSLTPTGCRRGG